MFHEVAGGSNAIFRLRRPSPREDVAWFGAAAARHVESS